MQALHLLEFIELNAILGVTHFTLYNHTIGPKASCILENYMTNGGVIQNLINGLPINSSTTNAKTNHSQNHSHQSPHNSYANSTTASNTIINGSSSSSDPHQRPKVTVDLLPWNLRMRSQKEIRTEGLFASLNDCLYRSMYRLV